MPTIERAPAHDMGGLKLTLVMVGLCLAVLLTGMDQTILATAAPTISNDFHALDDIAWWTNIYLLMLSSFQLFYGKLYTLFPIKSTYVGAIILFEIGSLICTTAPNSIALIFGRAIAGLGAAGIFSGGVLITTKVISLARRPAYLGIMSAVFGVAAIAGPFIGGALTDRATWRWCFGINLPIGVCTIVICIFLVHIPPETSVGSSTLKEKIQRFDIPGTFLMIAGLVCLLLGLQWGGGLYSWNSARVIALLVLSGVLLAAFTGSQLWHRSLKTKTIPTSISGSRDVWLAASYAMGLTGGIYVTMLYLPFWFQAIRGKTALSSGVLLTPTIGAYVVGSVISGVMTTATGYYNPGMILGCLLLIPGAALLTTLDPSMSISRVAGYELLYGFGAGFGFGQPSYLVQTLLPECDVPIGVTFITLVQNLSAAIFAAIGQSVFQNSLKDRLATIAPNSQTGGLLQTGAGDLIRGLPPSDRKLALDAFSDALIKTLYITLAVSCTTIFGAIGVRWQSMKSANSSDVGSSEPTSSPQQQSEVERTTASDASVEKPN